jgi:predicted RNA-binding Zn-ribbon protein involved in translation (DUF1610 family)
MATDQLSVGGQGFPCPQCGNHFRLTIAQLLNASQFTCANCGLVLTLERGESRPALDQLQAY